MWFEGSREATDLPSVPQAPYYYHVCTDCSLHFYCTCIVFVHIVQWTTIVIVWFEQIVHCAIIVFVLCLYTLCNALLPYCLSRLCTALLLYCVCAHCAMLPYLYCLSSSHCSSHCGRRKLWTTVGAPGTLLSYFYCVCIYKVHCRRKYILSNFLPDVIADVSINSDRSACH